MIMYGLILKINELTSSLDIAKVLFMLVNAGEV